MMTWQKMMCAAGAAGMITGGAMATTVSYNGGAYTQDFNGLPTSGNVTVPGRGPHAIQGELGATGMEGWYMANPAGSSSNTEFRAQDGSQSGSAGRGVVSFGTTDSTDRALGTLATSNQISSFGVLLTNNTGGTLTEATISFTGEQWRRGDVPSPNRLYFAYGFGSSIDDAGLFVSALNFVAPNTSTDAGTTEIALDGNLAANQQFLTHTITNLNWAPGETLALRWNGEDQTGQDDGLAIDNFSFTAVPEPGSLALLGLGGLALIARRRKA